jgi:hypothetical protein
MRVRVGASAGTRRAPGDGGRGRNTIRRTATVTAASPLDLLVLWGGDFRVLEREQPQVAESIRQAVTDRLGTRL